MSTDTPTYERVEVGDIQVGDRIARARTHDFEQVAAISVGNTAAHILNAAGQTIARPKLTAKWWREVQQQSGPAIGRYKVDVGVWVETTSPSADGELTSVEDVASAVANLLRGRRMEVLAGNPAAATLAVENVEATAQVIE